MKYLLVLVLTLCLACTATGQKLLQLENSGSFKTTRFYIGDEITFSLRNDDKGWYTRVINDFSLERNSVIFQYYELPLDSIEAIRLDRTNAMQFVGGALQTGGVNMMVFATYYDIFRDQGMDWGTFISGAASTGLGTLLRNIFRKKKFRPGKRKRLRLLDLNFGPSESKTLP